MIGTPSTYVRSGPSGMRILSADGGGIGRRPRMQRDRELHVQTEEGKSTDLAKPTEPTLRLAEGRLPPVALGAQRADDRPDLRQRHAVHGLPGDPRRHRT